MAGKNQHVVPVPGKGWGVRGAGNERLTTITPTKVEAEKVAREIAKNQQSEVVLHRRDGQIQDKDSFGHDPCPPKDKKH